MIATFYSYKGGVGRSMALANVAAWLALQGADVVVVDWDLEAPGLENFFIDDEPGLAQVRSRLGVIDILSAYKARFPEFAGRLRRAEDPLEVLTDALDPLRPLLFPVALPGSTTGAGKLSLLPAGWRDGERFADYSALVQSFDWAGFYGQYAGEAYFEWMRQQLSAAGDFVFIDSRTGVTEMGGVCTRQLSDVVVAMCAPNQQNLVGLKAMVSSFTRPEVQELRGRPLDVLVVPTRIDNSALASRNQFEIRFRAEMDDFTPLQLARRHRVFWDLRIPYVADFAYEEALVFAPGRRAEDLEDAYKNLAAYLAWFAPDSGTTRGLWGARAQTTLPTVDLPAVWHVPRLRVSTFVGRDTLLEQVRARLSGSGTAVLYGVGGSGKTATAVEYCHRRRNAFELVWWLDASSSETMVADFRRLAASIGVAGGLEHAPDDVLVEEIRRWLGQHQKWLLVFDDAPDLAAVLPYLPDPVTGEVLITARSAAVSEAVQAVEIPALPPDDSIALLRSAVGRDDPDWSELARAVSDLPLALHAAATYLSDTGISGREYLELFARHPLRLLDAGGGGAVSTTLTWSVQQARGASPHAASLLDLCARLAPAPIPLGLFTGAALPQSPARTFPAAIIALLTDRFALLDAIGALRRFGVAGSSDGELRLHPLLLLVARAASDEDAEVLDDAVDALLEHAFPQDAARPGAWRTCESLLPHVRRGATRRPRRASLLVRAARFLLAQGQPAAARQVLETTLGTITGPHDELSATAIVLLGQSMLQLDDLKGAEAAAQSVLSAHPAALGAQPEPLREQAMILAADVSRILHSPDAALQILSQAGPGDRSSDLSPELLTARARLSLALGDITAAMSAAELAALLAETRHGPDDPVTLDAMLAHALALLLAGDSDRARAVVTRARAAMPSGLAPGAPLGVALDLCAGWVSLDLGDNQEATRLFGSALTRAGMALPADHTLVAAARGSSGAAALAAGDATTARTLLAAAARTLQDVRGPSPALALVLWQLAAALAQLDEEHSAGAVRDDAVQMARAVLPPGHPLLTRLTDPAGRESREALLATVANQGPGLLVHLPGPAKTLRRAAVAATGRLVGAILENGGAATWEVPSGASHLVGTHSAMDVVAVAGTSFNDMSLVVGGPDGAQWWAGDIDATSRLLRHPARVTAVSLAAVPRAMLATGDDDGAVRVWHHRRDSPYDLRFAPLDASVVAVVLTSEARYLAAADATGLLLVMDVDGPMLARIPTPGSIEALDLSPDGRWAATGDAQGRIWVWEVSTGTPRLVREQSGGVAALRFDAAGESLVAASGDGSVAWVSVDPLAGRQFTRAASSSQLPPILALGVQSEAALLVGDDLTLWRWDASGHNGPPGRSQPR